MDKNTITILDSDSEISDGTPPALADSEVRPNRDLPKRNFFLSGETDFYRPKNGWIKFSIKELRLLIIFVLLVACTKSDHRFDIEKTAPKLLGLTLSEATDILGSIDSMYAPYHEPPMILRGLIGQLPNGTEIFLCIEKIPEPVILQDTPPKLTLLKFDEIKDKKVSNILAE